MTATPASAHRAKVPGSGTPITSPARMASSCGRVSTPLASVADPKTRMSSKNPSNGTVPTAPLSPIKRKPEPPKVGPNGVPSGPTLELPAETTADRVEPA